MTKDDVLSRCTIEGKVVKLPNVQLDRKLYQDVADALQKIGGKWNTKAKGFLFEHDPAPLLAHVQDGENVNLKKQYQFFETPPDVADFMVSHAFIEPTDLILEPSAGKGALINTIRKEGFKNEIHVCEINDLNWPTIEKLDVKFITGDFLLIGSAYFNQYDKIIANPPFTKNQDIDHFKMMWKCLKPGGRVVSVLSKTWTFGSQKKQTDFRKWIDEMDGSMYPLDEGSFKKSGTMVESLVVVIDKPK